MSSGTFYINDTIILKSYTILEGQGSGLFTTGTGGQATNIYLANTSNKTMISGPVGSTHIINPVIRNISLDGNKQNNTGVPIIQLDDTESALVQHVFLRNSASHGIQIDGSTYDTKWSVLDDISSFNGTGSGLYVNKVPGVQLTNSTLGSNYHGVEVISDGTATTYIIATLSNVYVDSSAHVGFKFTDIQYVQMSNIWSEANAEDGINLLRVAKANLSNINIREGMGGNYHGLMFDHSTDVNLSNFHIFSSANNVYGIAAVAAGSRNIFMSTGTIELTGTGTTGIYLGGDATNGEYHIRDVAVVDAVTPVTVEATIRDKVFINGSPGLNPLNRFVSTPSSLSDHEFDGFAAILTANVSATIGQVVYTENITGTMALATANTTTTMPAIAMATASISGNTTGTYLLSGFIRDDSWTWTPGGLLFVSRTTPGAITQTAPSTSGDQVQVIGIAITADIIKFEPNLVVVEIG